jgi:hypothetical protein
VVSFPNVCCFMTYNNLFRSNKVSTWKRLACLLDYIPILLLQQNSAQSTLYCIKFLDEILDNFILKYSSMLEQNFEYDSRSIYPTTKNKKLICHFPTQPDPIPTITRSYLHISFTKFQVCTRLYD